MIWTDEYRLAGIGKWEASIRGLGRTSMFTPGDRLVRQEIHGIVGEARKEYESQSPRQPFADFVSELRSENSRGLRSYWLNFDVVDMTRSSVTVLRSVSEKGEGGKEGQKLALFDKKVTLNIRRDEDARKALAKAIGFTISTRGGGEE